MRYFLYLLAVILCVNSSVRAQQKSEDATETTAAKTEKFFLRASDDARDLHFEISEQLQPRLRRGDSVVWMGEIIPSWSNTSQMMDNVYFSQAAFAPDGKSILVAAGRVTRLYAVSDGAIITDLSGKIGSQFAFSPDSLRVASVFRGSDEKPFVRIWNLARNDGEADWPLPAFERDVSGFEFYYKENSLFWSVEKLAWSPDSATIYLGLSLSRRIMVPADVRPEISEHWAELAALEVGTGQFRWQTALGEPTTRSFNDIFLNFALSGDGKRLGCGVNGLTRLVDAQSGAILQTDIDSWAQNAGFSGDSRIFFVAARNEAHFYRARDGIFVGARALTDFSPVPPYLVGRLPYLDQHGGVITTERGKFPLATMWRRGYDWEIQGARVRHLEGFFNLVWSPQGRALTFDSDYIYRWNASMTRIEARYEHPFRDVQFAQVEADERTLWVWGNLWSSDLQDRYTRFHKIIAGLADGSHIAALKIDLTSDNWKVMWSKPFGIYGISLSPDRKLGAMTEWRGLYDKKNFGSGPEGPLVSRTQIFDARSGRVRASIDVPFFASDASISNAQPAERLVVIHRQGAWETRLFALEKAPRQLWNEQVGGGFFIPGSADIFSGGWRINWRDPSQRVLFRNLNMLGYTKRGIFALRQVPDYRTAPAELSVDGNGNQHIIIDRNGRTLWILPKASLGEQLLDFAPNGEAVTLDGRNVLNFWRVQKSRD